VLCLACVLRGAGWWTVLCGVTYVLSIHSFRTVNLHRVSHDVCVYMYIQGVPGGICQTLGGCSLC